jgi:hypothetical protein
MPIPGSSIEILFAFRLPTTRPLHFFDGILFASNSRELDLAKLLTLKWFQVLGDVVLIVSLSNNTQRFHALQFPFLRHGGTADPSKNESWMRGSFNFFGT